MQAPFLDRSLSLEKTWNVTLKNWGLLNNESENHLIRKWRVKGALDHLAKLHNLLGYPHSLSADKLTDTVMNLNKVGAKRLPELAKFAQKIEPQIENLSEKLATDFGISGRFLTRQYAWSNGPDKVEETIDSWLNEIQKNEHIWHSCMMHLGIPPDLESMFKLPSVKRTLKKLNIDKEAVLKAETLITERTLSRLESNVETNKLCANQVRRLIFMGYPEDISDRAQACLTLIKQRRITLQQIADGNKTQKASERIDAEMERRKTKIKIATERREKTELEQQTMRKEQQQIRKKNSTRFNTNQPRNKRKKENLHVILDDRIKRIQRRIRQEVSSEKQLSTSHEILLIKHSEAQDNLTEKEVIEAKRLRVNSKLRAAAEMRKLDLSGIPQIDHAPFVAKAYSNGKKDIIPTLPEPLSSKRIERNAASDNDLHTLQERNATLSDARDTLITLLKQNSEQNHKNIALEYDINDIKRRLELLETRIMQTNVQSAQIEDMVEKAPLTNTASISAYPPLSEMETWVKNSIPKGRIIILKQAFDSAAQSKYEDPDLVFQTVELLANEYRDQILSGKKSEEERSIIRGEFIRKSTELGLTTLGKSLSTKSTRALEKHSVLLDGQKVYLNRHMGKGNSQDKDRCLRVYFAWLPEKESILIGHMPSHL